MNPMSEAPKNRVILLNVGLPWYVAGMWNEPQEQWVYANSQADLFEGEYNDTYFENEWDIAPEGWIPMPEIPNDQ